MLSIVISLVSLTVAQSNFTATPWTPAMPGTCAALVNENAKIKACGPEFMKSFTGTKRDANTDFLFEFDFKTITPSLCSSECAEGIESIMALHSTPECDG